MKKTLLSLLLILSFFGALAQNTKKDTITYYFKFSGVVSLKENSDYNINIIAADKKSKSKLFVVKAYYNNGNPLFSTFSSSKNDLVFEGAYTGYYINGNKMVEENYEKGKVDGNVNSYFPNGQLYSKQIVYKNSSKIYLSDCVDSTGKVSAINGFGKWIEYSDDFKTIRTEGQVKDGIREGEWHGKINNKNFTWQYQNGIIIKRQSSDDSLTTKLNPRGEKAPVFPGGLEAFGMFLSKNIRYPSRARKDNTSGSVLVSFVIERDGGVTDVKVVRGIGDGCDEEAIRVMELSPKWMPGVQDGHPVRVAFSVPIVFRLN